MLPDHRLPRTTTDIARWLGGEDPTRIGDIRAGHGDAAVVVALVRVRELPVARRGPAFFASIGAMQRRRKWAGDWPAMTFRSWVNGYEPAE